VKRPVRIRWTPRARLRLAAILRTILEEAGPVVEVEWARRFLEAPNVLAGNPTLGRIVPEIGREDIREIGVRPFRIVYRVSPTICYILSIRHSRRRIRSVRGL
jgi:plasmid stabilization system protein ParE